MGNMEGGDYSSIYQIEIIDKSQLQKYITFWKLSTK